MLRERYNGSFLSKKSVKWTCKIFQESSTAFTVEELDFPANSPLVIDWAATGKEDVICGSTCQLTIVSPGDRTYTDLYTEIPGSVRLDIYCNDMLYWSGLLDTEFYEEPYSRYNNYEVQLTFSDFGILHRLSYNLSGMQTLQAILDDALTRSGIQYNDIMTLISTKIGNSDLTLGALSVMSENFFDEEGNPMNLYDVIEGILRPLALRIAQKAADVWVYDINALYASRGADTINWASDDQMLGVDRVYNNVKITLSVYGSDADYPDGVEYTDAIDPTVVNLDNNPHGEYIEYSYYVNLDDPHVGEDIDYRYLGFSIFLSSNAKGLASKDSRAYYYKFAPLLRGEDGEGVAYWFYTGGHGPLSGGLPRRKGASSELTAGTPIMTTSRVSLPEMNATERKDYEIRVQVPMLIDARYNPFDEDGDGNEHDNYVYLKGYVHKAFIPCKIQLYNASGTVLYHYENRASGTDVGWDSDGQTVTKFNSMGRWVSGAAGVRDCQLEYYDQNDRFGCGILGWHTNRQAGGMNMELYPSMKEQDDGQYIPYPPVGGFLEVQVCAGVTMYDENHLERTGAREDIAAAILAKTRWFLFQGPKVEMMKAGVVEQSLGTDDIEYSGTLNANAEDGLSIDTICGTAKTPAPNAKGLFHKTSDGSFLTELTRQSRTDTAEQLLIGTLYSQFAARKTRLYGTADIILSSVRKLTDPALPSGTVLMLLAESQDVIEDESTINAVEIAADNYTSA